MAETDTDKRVRWDALGGLNLIVTEPLLTHTLEGLAVGTFTLILAVHRGLADGCGSRVEYRICQREDENLLYQKHNLCSG
jgi:hypothetical protein